MIKRERKHRIDMTILDRHKEISPRMRSVLIDWLIEVSEVYRLHRYENLENLSNKNLTVVFRETLYMAVNYVDRYLSRQSTPTRKSELQLIGVSALFFAAKLEEIYPPKLAEFAYVTDSACTEMEMREMELMMLKVNLALSSLNLRVVRTDSLYVGSVSFRHWFQKWLGSVLPLI